MDNQQFSGASAPSPSEFIDVLQDEESGSEVSHDEWLEESEMVDLKIFSLYEMDAEGQLHYLIGGVPGRCPTPPVSTRTHMLDERVVFHEDDGREQAANRGGPFQHGQLARRAVLVGQRHVVVGVPGFCWVVKDGVRVIE